MQSLLRKAGPSATDMIRADHARVLTAFHRYKADTSPSRKKAIVSMICTALQVHAKIEEEVFYPAMRQAGSTMLDELEPEHEEMRSMIASLSGMDPSDPQYDATFMELMRTVIHHVADEETMLLASAEAVAADRLGELGAQMMKRRMELMGPRAGAMALQKAQAFPGGLAMAAGALLAGMWLFRRAR